MKITQDARRKIIQVAAFGFTNSHLGNFAAGSIYQGSWKNFCSPGLNCYSCPAAGFACPIGAMQAVGGSPKYGISFYAVGFALAFGVIFGRAVCGYLCPFGLIQELLNRIPSPKRRIPKPLTYIKYVLLFGLVLLFPVFVTDEFGYGAPAFCEYICPAGTLEGGLPLLIAHPELRAQLGGIFIAKAAILLLTIAGCIVVFRFFCKVMCPLGAIYGLLNKVSFYRLTVDENKCVHCCRCAKVCQMDVDPVKHPNSPECIRCGACAAHCPTKAIRLGYGVFQRKEKSEEAQKTA